MIRTNSRGSIDGVGVTPPQADPSLGARDEERATGMRRGELLALRWADVDLSTGTAAVRRSIEQTKEGLRLKSPKGKKGRQIVLLSVTTAALKVHREAQNRQKLALGHAYQDQDLICAREDGSLWPPDTFTGDFSRLAQKAGFKGVRLHDLRHSHASQLLLNGVHAKVVSERLGHSTVGITLDLYTHVLPGLQEDAARKLNFAMETAIENQRQKSLAAGISKGLAN